MGARMRVRGGVCRAIAITTTSLVLSLMLVSAAYGLTGADVGAAVSSGQVWLKAHQGEGGMWGSGASAWRDTQLALQALETTPGISVAGVESRLASATINTDAMARAVLGGHAAGLDVSELASALAASQQDDGGFALADSYLSDVWDTQLALEAFSDDATSAVQAAQAVAYLVAEQNEDGGWSVCDDGASDAAMTAEVVRTLSLLEGGVALDEAGVAARDRGRGWLAVRLGANGSMGDSFFDTVSAVRALAAAHASYDASAAASWILGQRTEDGGFGSVRDTALGVLALDALGQNVAVTSVTVSNPTPREDEIVQVSALVENTGPRAIANVDVAFVVGPVAVGAEAHRTVVRRLPAHATTTVTFNYQVPCDADGAIQITAIANRSCGLAEIDDSDNATSVAIDVQGPLGTPTPITPADNGSASDVTPSFAWSLSAADVGGSVGEILQLDRSPSFDSPMLRTIVTDASVGGPLVRSVAVAPALAEGTWYWRVRALSGSALSSWSGVRTVRVDTVAPQLSQLGVSASVFSPNGDGVKDSVRLDYVVSEDATVSVTAVNADGDETPVNAAAREGGPVRETWDGDGTGADGTYRLKLTATDAAGNSTSALSSAVVVDRSAPSVQDLSSDITSFSPNADGYLDAVHLAWTASTSDPTIVSISGPGGVIKVDTVTSNSYTWDGRTVYGVVAPDGEYTLSVVARDAAGNSSASQYQTVRLKTTCVVGQPKVEPTVVAPGGQAKISVRVDDESTVTVSVDGTTYPMADAGDGTRFVTITASETPGNHRISLSASDSLRNTLQFNHAAVIVRASEVQGSVWRTDTYDEFRLFDYMDGAASWAVEDGATIEGRRGSLQLGTHPWETVGQMSVPRYGSANTLGPDGKLYAFGGYYYYFTSGSNLYVSKPVRNSSVFDPETGEWVELPQSPSPRKHARASVSPDGRIFVIGGIAYDSIGQSTGPSDIVEAFDPQTNTWETDTNHGGTLAPMPTAREELGVATGHDGRVYCVGGYSEQGDSGESSDVLEIYDPIANTWTSGAPLPQKACCFASVGKDGKIYVMEGEYFLRTEDGADSTSLSKAWAYDTVLGTWATLPDSPMARTGAMAATAVDGRVYVYGGVGRPDSQRKAYAFDPVTEDWFRSSDLLVGVRDTQGAADVHGRVYVLGGVHQDESIASYAVTQSGIQRLDPSFNPTGTYISPAVRLPMSSFGAIRWTGAVPDGTSVSFATRSSLDRVSWSEWSEEYVASGSTVQSPPGRYLQYRVRMTSDVAAATPRIDDVSIVYNRAPGSPSAIALATQSHTPTLTAWRPEDPEGDPIAYDVQIDQTSAFDSPSLVEFGAMNPETTSSVAFRVPAASGLADGEYRWRVRSNDGHGYSDWGSSARLCIDSTPPDLSLESLEPAVAVAGLGPQASFSVNEGAWVRTLVQRYTNGQWIAFSDATGWRDPGTRTWTWNGLNTGGVLAASGQYRLVMSATDSAGNRSVDIVREFAVRTPPVIRSIEPSSAILDPQGAVSVVATCAGDVTHVRANANGAASTLIASGGNRFAGDAGLVAPARRVSLDIAACDAVAETTSTLNGGRLDIPGAFDANALTVSSASDFARGASDSMLISGDALALPSGAWALRTSSLATPRSDPMSAQSGSRIYVLGGNMTPVNKLAVEVHDLATGASTMLPDMPNAHSRGMATADSDGRVYVIGGISGSVANMVDRYDPASGAWQALAALPSSRAGGAAFSHAGHVYVVGTEQGGQVLDYDVAAGSWSTKGSMPTPATSGSGVLFDDKIYYFGGLNSQDKLQIYDIASNSWTSEPMPMTYRETPRCADVVGDAIILHGHTFSAGMKTLRFDPATHTYESLPAMTANVQAAAHASWDGSVYSLGGSLTQYYDTAYTANVYRYQIERVGYQTSHALDAGRLVQWDKIGWTAYLPQDTTVTVCTRSSVDGTAWSDWSDWCSTGDAIDSPPGRYIQWRAMLRSANGNWAPVLGDVTVGIAPDSAQSDLTVPQPIGPVDSVVFDPSPTLEWANGTGGIVRSYEVQIDAWPEFDSGLQYNYTGLAETDGSSRLYIPSAAPLEDSVWFWRVRTNDGERVSAWSEPAAFLVAFTPLFGLDDPMLQPATEGDIVDVPMTVYNFGAPAEATYLHLTTADGTQVAPPVRVPALANEATTCVTFHVDTRGRVGDTELHAAMGSGASAVDLPFTLTVLPPRSEVSVAPMETDVHHADEATFTATVTSSADVTQTGTLALTLTDAEGVTVEALPPVDLELAPSEARSTVATWSPVGIYAGDYRVRAEFKHGSAVRASSAASFTIVPDVAVSARVGLDSIEYAAGEKLTASSRVTNNSANMVLDAATVRTSIVDSSGATLATDEVAVNDLMRGASRVSRFEWDTSVAIPDEYRAVESVLLSDGTQAASSEETFTIKPTSATGDGLVVSMVTTPADVVWSESSTVRLTVLNDGNSAISGVPVKISVVDPQTTGTVLWHSEAALTLVPGEATTVTATCPTSELATTFAGEPRDLLVVAQAQFAEGLVTLDHAVLHVNPLRVSAQLAADKPSYDCNEPVTLTATASNDTTDFPLSGATAHIELAGPDGNVLTLDRPLAEIADGDSSSVDVAWNTGVSAPGTYTATVDVRYMGQSFASGQTSFQVISTADSGVGLTGTLSPAHVEVTRGDPLTFSYSTTDLGNADIAFMPVAVVLTDGAGQQVAEVTSTVTVTRTAPALGTASFDSAQLLSEVATQAAGFSATLVATLPSGVKTLASATATVKPVPPVSGGGVAIGSEIATGTRALVLAQSTADANLARRALAGALCYHIADDTDEFLTQLRTGIYNTYVLLDPVRPLRGNAERELAEKVFAGATLIASRGSGMDCFGRTDMLGLKFNGYTTSCGSRSLSVDAGPRTPALTTSVEGKVRKVSLEGASVLAAFSSSLPAITYHAYGRGSAMYFTFDLASVDAADADALLAAAQTGCPPNEAPPTCGDVVAVVTTLTNHESAAIDASVTANVVNGQLLSASDRCDDHHDHHPGGCWPHAPRHHDCDGWRYHRIRWCNGAFDRHDEPGFGHDGRGPCTPPDAPTATWRLALASGESTTVVSLVRLPWREGTMTYSAAAAPAVGTPWEPVTSTLSVAATDDIAALYADAIAKTRAIQTTSRCETRAKSAVLSTLSNLADWRPSRRSQCSGTLDMLLDAAETLESLAADTREAHYAVDEIIASHEARSAL